MIVFLIVSAITLSVFGVLLFFAPGIIVKISDFLNRNILTVDEKMRVSNRLTGIVFLLLGIALCYIVFKK